MSKTDDLSGISGLGRVRTYDVSRDDRLNFGYVFSKIISEGLAKSNVRFRLEIGET
jgi:hypothetical protein